MHAHVRTGINILVLGFDALNHSPPRFASQAVIHQSLYVIPYFKALGPKADTFLIEDVCRKETLINKLSQIAKKWKAYGSELCFYNSSLTYQWKRSLLSPKIECQRSGRGAS